MIYMTGEIKKKLKLNNRKNYLLKEILEIKEIMKKLSKDAKSDIDSNAIFTKDTRFKVASNFRRRNCPYIVWKIKRHCMII